MLVVGRTHLIMSDFPELRLLDEVQDLATSSDFFAFTRDQFNRAWEDESSSRDDFSSSDDHSTVGLWQTPERGQQPEWGRDLYERNLWDPMLCDGFRTGTAGTDAELFDASQQQHEEDEEGDDAVADRLAFRKSNGALGIDLHRAFVERVLCRAHFASR